MTLEQVRQRAQKGDAKAQFSLGCAYHKGVEVPKSYSMAAKWIKRAADQGNMSAQFTMGCMYWRGMGVSRSREESEKYYRMAAEQGDTEAQFSLADSLFRHNQIADAFPWFRKASENGHGLAQVRLAEMYERGQGIPADISQSHAWFVIAAQNGESIARSHCVRVEKGMLAEEIEAAHQLLGIIVSAFSPLTNPDMLFESGLKHYKGTKFHRVNYAEAFSFFLAAASRGHVSAQNFIGLMYDKGEGVAADVSTATEWFTKAANQGLPVAQYNLGMKLKQTLKDEDAIFWLRKASEQNYLAAMYAVGEMCFHSAQMGMTQKFIEAEKMFRLAAEQGHAEAQNCLANMHESGEGVEANQNEAVKWHRKAAEQGHLDSRLAMCAFYENGLGVAQDLVEAEKWYRLASEQSPQEVAIRETFGWARKTRFTKIKPKPEPSNLDENPPSPTT